MLPRIRMTLRWALVGVTALVSTVGIIVAVAIILLSAAAFGLAQYFECHGTGWSPELREEPTHYAQETPQWSPDGTAIVTQWRGVVYAVTASGDGMWTIPRTRSLLKWMMGDGSARYSPAVSSAGQVAYLEKARCRTLKVKTVDLRGHSTDTQQRKLPYHSAQVAWSSDGIWLAFGAQKDSAAGDKRIVTRRYDHGETIELIVDDESFYEEDIQALRWSPDGRLAVVWGRYRNLSVGSVDQEFKPVDGVNRRVFSPVWSPDGRHLYYALVYESAPPEGNVAIIRLDPVTLKRQTVFAARGFWEETDAAPGDLELAPDGRLLLSLTNRGYGAALYVEGRDGQFHDILPTISAESGLPFAFPGKGILNASWSPDGSRIAVRNGYWMTDVALFTVRPDGTDVRPLLRRGDDLKLILANSSN